MVLLLGFYHRQPLHHHGGAAAGVAASMEIFGVSKYVSVPVAAVLVWSIVVMGLLHEAARRRLEGCRPRERQAGIRALEGGAAQGVRSTFGLGRRRVFRRPLSNWRVLVGG